MTPKEHLIRWEAWADEWARTHPEEAQANLDSWGAWLQAERGEGAA